MIRHDLKSIDLLFEPSVYLLGEKLYNEGGVVEINKTGSSIYEVYVSDDKILEVELRNPLTKSQKAICECDVFKSKSACHHIVAAYLAVKQLKVQKIVKNSGKPKSLNINSLLEVITEAELKSFIKNYSTSDKKFSTMLKVNFARKLELENNYDKYKNILDSVLRPITKVARTVSINELKTLSNIVKDLIEQAKDAFALNQYVEVMHICTACIHKCNYAITHFDHKTAELKQLSISLHQLLFDLYRAPAAADLKDNIIVFFKEALNLSYFQLNSEKFNGLEFLAFNDLLAKNEVLSEITKRLEGEPTNEDIVILHSIRFRILKGDEFDKALNIDSKYARYIELIIDDVISCGDINTAVKLLDYYVNKDPKNLRLSLKNTQVRYKLNGSKALKEIASVFLNSKNLEIIDYIKTSNDSHSQELVRIIEKNNDFSSFKESIYYPYYLAKIEAWDNLLDFLNGSKDIHVLRQFDKYLYAHRQLLTIILYEETLEYYLNTHIGDMSIQYLNDLYYHLKSYNALALISKISVLLKTKFNHRSGIEKTLFRI